MQCFNVGTLKTSVTCSTCRPRHSHRIQSVTDDQDEVVDNDNEDINDDAIAGSSDMTLNDTVDTVLTAEEHVMKKALEEAFPSASESMKLLLREQSENLKKKDPRQRRWSSEVIGVCL